MIEQIVSGGQTGADRAALDAAIEAGVPHGGWVPKGRLAEDGRIPDQYQMKESDSINYARRTEQNVIDSDGTLIVSFGPLTGGSRLTYLLAEEHGKPVYHVDLAQVETGIALTEISQWIERQGIRVLNVAGPRASQCPGIYAGTLELVKRTLTG